MRTVVILLIAIVLGGFFIAQKRHQQNVAAEKPATQQTSSPRPVSEHNWAKHALDTTSKVTRQVAKQQKEDDVRK
jgi:hypothetical protein